MPPGISEIARFLARRAPFDDLDPDELGELARHTEVEFHLAGAPILTEDGGPVTFLRVVHSGAVDITREGRLLDLLGVGDVFGHAAMLAGLPPGFEARAAEDTLCYRIPVAAARPLLDRARTRELPVGVSDPARVAVASLIRTQTVVVSPEAPIGEVALAMTDAGANSAIVELPGGALGIVTDRDVRSRVVARGLPAGTPVHRVMSTPVFSARPEHLAADVLFELLERGIRHAPVVSESGQLVGVVEDADLFGVRPRSWFGLRRAIARARDGDALAAVARRIPEIMLDLHAARMRALEVARVLSALVDALTVRGLELASESVPLPADGLVWVAVGSLARRELTPASTPIGAVAFDELPPFGWMSAAAEILVRCGLPAATSARGTRQWAAAGLADPLAIAVLTDRRALFGTPRLPLPVIGDESREAILAALAREATALRPPTGFDGEAVLDADGGRSRMLDLHQAAIVPIAAIARWAGALAGRTEGSTAERLQHAGGAGVLEPGDARALLDAFTVAFELRVGAQMERLAADGVSEDLLEPGALSPFVRDQLREVFRTIAAVQRRIPA